MLNLIEASNKVSRVVNSAKTWPQKKAADKYAQLFRDLVNREVNKLHPIRDFVVLVLMVLFAVIGVATVLSMVAQGLID